MPATLPDWLEPMAATLTQDRFGGDEWLFERKFDGIRLLAYKNRDDVRLFSRNRLPQHLPQVAAAVARLPVEDVILDGEVDLGRQEWLSRVRHPLAERTRRSLSLPLEERRALLHELPFTSPLQRVALLDDDKPWERARREGWEGVIAKRRGSPYEHRRSKHWLKMKCEASQELVVGRLYRSTGRARRSRSAAGGLLRGRRLRVRGEDSARGSTQNFCSTSGSGSTPSNMAQSPFTKAKGLPRLRAHWVRPEIVVQVAFIEWTVHGKLRHPAVAGRALRQESARGHPRTVITHPEKLLFPDGGITKGDLAAYYEAIAPVMLPHLRGRPVTMERYPAGIDKKGFWQKDVSKGFPEWLERVRGSEKRRRGSPSDRNGPPLAVMGRQSEHDHAARVDLSRAGSVSSGYLRIRPRPLDRTIRRQYAPRRSACVICSTSSACRRGSRRRARKVFTSSFRLDGKHIDGRRGAIRQWSRERSS